MDRIVYLPSQTSVKLSSSSTHEFKENIYNDYLPSSCSGENDDNLVVFSSPPTLTPPSPFIEVNKSNSSSKNEKKSRKKSVKTVVEVLPQITEENNNILPKIRSTSQKKTHLPSQATEKPYKFDGEIITEIKNEYLKQIVNLPSRATANLSSPSQATENPYNLPSQATANSFSSPLCPDKKMKNSPDLILPPCPLVSLKENTSNLPSRATENPYNSSTLCFDEKMNNESKNIDRMLEREKEHNKTENWNKLDKTAKMQKLAAYSEKYGKDNNLTAKEISQLKIFFNESLDKSKLQKSKDVIYNKESKEITSVPSLYLNTNTHNFSFKITDSKRVSTIKSLTPKRINILEESN